MKQNNATKTSALIERINRNESNQNLDLNQWAFNLIKGSKQKLKILELCPGTGRQTEQLLRSFENSHVTCVDVSNESLKVIEKSSFFDNGRVHLINDNIDDYFEKNKIYFDVVFVSYGLYYAKKIDRVLGKIFSYLNKGGRFIVLGPYGDNNKQLFALLKSIGVKVEKFVKYSSSDFMYSSVLNKTLRVFETIIINTAVNEVKWSNPDEVVQYWENSTFYRPQKRDIFLKEVENHFASQTYFINEKHIMLIECKRGK
jgi:ubiquinone/menaquinone biosynthesis C-methylase UbiE